LVSAVFGGIFAKIEGWDLDDGILYVGGDMVLIPLTPKVPTTVAGMVADFLVSCVTLGILAWVLALVGSFPACDLICTWIGGKRTGKGVTGKTVVTMTSLALMFLIVLPAVICVIAAVFAIPVAAVDGRRYLSAFEQVLGILSHAGGLAPAGKHDMTLAGKMLGLWIAFLALELTLGIIVGVYVALPFTGKFADFLSKPVSGRGFLAKLLHFKACVLLGIPLILLPLAAALGALLAAVDDWPSTMDGLLYVGGSMVLLPLTPVVPTSDAGKACDFMISCFGVGVFGLVLALVGAHPFVDACCEKLGGKSERPFVAHGFTLAFFLVLMPFTCMVMAVPLGGVLAMGEDWSFADGWLFAASVLVQAPALAPKGAVPTTQGGQLLVFCIAVFALSTTLGLGAGMIVASNGLGSASKVIMMFLAGVRDLEAKAGIEEFEPVAPRIDEGSIQSQNQNEKTAGSKGAAAESKAKAVGKEDASARSSPARCLGAGLDGKVGAEAAWAEAQNAEAVAPQCDPCTDPEKSHTNVISV
jgi:hypothetical protein